MRWNLFVGDSRARLAFAALLSLSGVEIPTDWPHHDLSGACAARWRNATGEGYGYYDPACQGQWKGGCLDNAKGRHLSHACTLDVRAGPGYRATFVWHSFNSPQHLAHLKKRLRTLAPRGAPTPAVIFASSGMWDMLEGRRATTCPRLRKFTTMLTAFSADVRVMGFAECPACGARRECLNWRSGFADLAPAMDTCVATALAPARAVNITGITAASGVDPICGNMHLFGRGSETLVADLSMRPTERRRRARGKEVVDFAALNRTWRSERYGTYRWLDHTADDATRKTPHNNKRTARAKARAKLFARAA